MRTRQWTLENDHEYQYSDGVPASIIVARGPEIEEHRRVRVVERSDLTEAAPDLLEQCKEAERVMTAWGNQFGVSGDFGARLSDLRAAIAKAEGRE